MPDFTYLFIWRVSTPALTNWSFSFSKTAISCQGRAQLTPSLGVRVIYPISESEAYINGTSDFKRNRRIHIWYFSLQSLWTTVSNSAMSFISSLWALGWSWSMFSILCYRLFCVAGVEISAIKFMIQRYFCRMLPCIPTPKHASFLYSIPQCKCAHLYSLSCTQPLYFHC